MRSGLMLWWHRPDNIAPGPASVDLAGDVGRRGTSEPGLKHQDGPERALMITLSAEMFMPSTADGGGIEQSSGRQTAVTEQRLGPVA